MFFISPWEVQHAPFARRGAGLSTLGSEPLLGGVSSPSLHRGVGGGSEFSASRLRTERWEGRGRGSDRPFHRDASRGGRAGAWPRGPGFACVQQGTVEAGREQACGGQASGRAADGRMRAGLPTPAGRTGRQEPPRGPAVAVWAAPASQPAPRALVRALLHPLPLICSGQPGRSDPRILPALVL